MALLNTEPSLPKHKKLTKFLCQELLYEYVSGSLDRERERAVNEFTADCRETQHELEKLRFGLNYVQQAGSVQLAPELRDGLLNFEPQWKKAFRAWSLWSSQRGWRMLPYVFLLAALGLGLLVTKPWQKDVRQDVILAEQLRQEPDMLPPNSPELNALAGEIGKVAEPSVVEKSPMNLPPSPTVGVQAELTPPISTTPAVPAVPAVPAKTPAKEKTVVQNDVDDDHSTSHNARGLVYRGEMQVSDFTNSWPAIRDKILSLGGKVAGNVELGWLRAQGQSYFHFSLPESNMNELELFLGTFGQVRFNKERHLRVMPEGQLRIILTVKDGGNHEAPAEAP